MNILGLGGSIHDFSACILSKGETAVAIEEERLTKKKYAVHNRSTFRCKAAEYCLSALDLSMDQIDAVVGNDLIESDYYMKYADKIKLYNHHLTHASSTYYPSPYDEAAVLVIDGRGSYINEEKRIRETISMYVADLNEIHCIQKSSGQETDEFSIVTNSIGMFLQYVTVGMGYSEMNEIKMIKLSHGGTDRFLEDFNDFYTLHNGQFLQGFEELEALKQYLEEKLKEASEPNSIVQCKKDLAFAAQYHLERIVVYLCQRLYQITKKQNLCLAGGIFENAQLLMKIKNEVPFQNIYTPSFMGDAGTSIGAALLYHHTTNKLVKKRPDLQVGGKCYSTEELVNHLSESKYRIYTKEELIKVTAQLLTRGYLIGIFTGKSSFGRYPNGQRNIVGDARVMGLKKKLLWTKKRESLDPFSILNLEQSQQITTSSVFNLCYLKEPDQFPLVINEDHSTYFLPVKKNTFISQILEEYYTLSDIPFLLNTPLKKSDETLIETPMEAFDFFRSTDLDALVLEDHLIVKNSNS
ncbi:carbamoyltransferase [Fictibacillus solisalsi]|uniref:Carbamoyltransferase n=1 Tax=Fictibacillus solisalsi TaxID=459525 RepID=A0A1H0BS01_9BACL|nr:carbamoyltransferase N-terminal domain-containing protein [Fictibacillus solisalsi]SDN48360.1 carbamoyltransferase [Fictibacillus solisalsi]